jgi:hypothetical protein
MTSGMKSFSSQRERTEVPYTARASSLQGNDDNTATARRDWLGHAWLSQG